MTSGELRKKYIKFFEQRGHVHIPSAPLVPKEDPTTLFVSAGMQPLVPYLLGEKHPAGKRLVNWQQCLRTDDIDEVGDATHLTFFEMLGNWSLGDYWKDEAISLSFEFLTKELSIPLTKLAVTVFAGDKDAPRDNESVVVWRKLGISEDRIFALGKEDNWWGPAGPTGPCGPDTEMFVWTGGSEPEGSPDKDNRWVEIWNDVFMEYNKTENGKYEPLAQKNVDTGMGLERTIAVLQNKQDNYETELFLPIVQSIEELSGAVYSNEVNKKSIRIVADHIRAVVFVLAEGVIPSNKERGYILRRLIRRAMRYAKIIGPDASLLPAAETVVKHYTEVYPELEENRQVVKDQLQAEEERFRNALAKGLREIEKIKTLDGKTAFYLYETYGFPLELTQEIAKDRGKQIDNKAFEEEFQKHKELSKTASAGMFKGGLARSGEQETKYHTATHLLHQALRGILGDHVIQRGSNITAERLRFDFSHPEKLTDEQIGKVEGLVNEQIQKGLPVSWEEMDKDKALASGALGAFGERYTDSVKVYTIGSPSARSADAQDKGSGPPFSQEICGGPHVGNTAEIGRVKITREESAGAGVRRIYAVISD